MQAVADELQHLKKFPILEMGTPAPQPGELHENRDKNNCSAEQKGNNSFSPRKPSREKPTCKFDPLKKNEWETNK
jgi:hypothetical protein